MTTTFILYEFMIFFFYLIIKISVPSAYINNNKYLYGNLFKSVEIISQKKIED